MPPQCVGREGRTGTEGKHTHTHTHTNRERGTPDLLVLSQEVLESGALALRGFRLCCWDREYREEMEAGGGPRGTSGREVRGTSGRVEVGVEDLDSRMEGHRSAAEHTHTLSLSLSVLYRCSYWSTMASIWGL